MSHQKRFLLDTNIILRFLLADHPTLSKKAKNIFKEAEKGGVELFVNHTTIAEVFWVLESFYQLSRQELIQILSDLLRFPNLRVTDKRMILKTLNLLARENVSYIDAYNLIFARKNNLELKTFDRKLEKLAREKRVDKESY